MFFVLSKNSKRVLIFAGIMFALWILFPNNAHEGVNTDTKNVYNVSNAYINSIPKVNKDMAPLKPVKAIVFSGRRKNLRLLHPYLFQNLQVNGGVLSGVIFMIRTHIVEDVKYIEDLVAQHPKYYTLMHSKTWEENYQVLPADETYFKIDDDIIFIRKGSLEAMARAFYTGRWLAMSANIVNHIALSKIHADIGALYQFKDNGTVSHQLQGSPLGDLGHPDGVCAWSRLSCGVQQHLSFIKNYWEDTLDAYDFRVYDFHAFAYHPFSINFLIMNGTIGYLVREKDELEISLEIPKKLDEHIASLGKALVVHLGFFPQNNELAKYPDLQNFIMKSYETIAKNECPSIAESYWEVPLI